MATTYRTRSQLLRVKSWAALVERIEAARSQQDEHGVSHYFDTVTVRLFGNQWHGVPVTPAYMSDLYFIESSTDTPDGSRRYAIRAIYHDGHVSTISEWPHYATLADAEAALRFEVGTHE